MKQHQYRWVEPYILRLHPSQSNLRVLGEVRAALPSSALPENTTNPS